MDVYSESAPLSRVRETQSVLKERQSVMCFCINTQILYIYKLSFILACIRVYIMSHLD
jgi:hypothetical protein